MNIFSISKSNGAAAAAALCRVVFSSKTRLTEVVRAARAAKARHNEPSYGPANYQDDIGGRLRPRRRPGLR